MSRAHGPLSEPGGGRGVEGVEGGDRIRDQPRGAWSVERGAAGLARPRATSCLWGAWARARRPRGQCCWVAARTTNWSLLAVRDRAESFTGFLTSIPNYLCSRSAETALPHSASTLPAGEAIDTVARAAGGDRGRYLGAGGQRHARSGAARRGPARRSRPAGVPDRSRGSGTTLFVDGERVDMELTRSVSTGCRRAAG